MARVGRGQGRTSRIEAGDPVVNGAEFHITYTSPPGRDDVPSRPPVGCVTLYLCFFMVKLRLPLQPFLYDLFLKCQICTTKLNPNGWGLYYLQAYSSETTRVDGNNSKCTVPILVMTYPRIMESGNGSTLRCLGNAS
ncbi:hypothetical protein PanWU01x14_315000 [Parasponia andersonii]|uniref:Uncharacterized protein n=1 Tax=Parasponia andersonii TaxID=3476 RepID=A0A2P5ANN2_PARAD|nr:hypothetical protein PanWU01x14_315000 [Parasponia andersonii]